jgi:4-hydroxy-3-methylbut-2-enyl diphosphate reductase
LKGKKVKIIKASHIGFCFGVKRAVGSAEKFLKKHKKAYSLGPIIHNPSVVEDLSGKGLEVISDIKKAKGSCLIIRSHGISPRLKVKASELSIDMLDATCPFVKRSHAIVTRLKKESYKIIIIGEKNHPEVKALLEVAGAGALVAIRESDLNRLSLRDNKIAVVAQTTLSRDRFFMIVESILQLNCLECRIFDTICNDVVQRQTEAKRLAKKADLVFVVGGKISANTRQLAQICRQQGAKTYHIETAKELKPSWFKAQHLVGVVSGASTPAGIVEKVVTKIKKNNIARRN